MRRTMRAPAPVPRGATRHDFSSFERMLPTMTLEAVREIAVIVGADHLATLADDRDAVRAIPRARTAPGPALAPPSSEGGPRSAGVTLPVSGYSHTMPSEPTRGKEAA